MTEPHWKTAVICMICIVAGIQLWPENDREKRLLGAVVPHGAECEVHTKYEGHFSHQNMEVVRLILKAPVSITEPPGTGE